LVGFAYQRRISSIKDKDIIHTRKNASNKEKNFAEAAEEYNLLQKIIPLLLHPLQQRIRILSVDNQVAIPCNKEPQNRPNINMNDVISCIRTLGP
jgi:hypothetical protein